MIISLAYLGYFCRSRPCRVPTDPAPNPGFLASWTPYPGHFGRTSTIDTQTRTSARGPLVKLYEVRCTVHRIPWTPMPWIQEPLESNFWALSHGRLHVADRSNI